MKILFCIIMICIIDSNPAYAVHDEVGKVRCLDCHPRLPFNRTRAVLSDGAGDICVGCHTTGGKMSETISHPVNVVPSMAIPRDLPTDAHGRMTCITCHTFHQGGYRDAGGNKRYFLRRQRGKAFCYTCHKKL